MAEYAVDIQNEESNQENVSVTGTVNGVQTAMVIRAVLLPKTKQARQKAIAEALVEAFKNKPAAKTATLITVSD